MSGANETPASKPPNYYMTVVVPEGEGLNAMEWYKTALNATEKACYKNKDGTLMHGHLNSAYGFPLGVDEITPKESNCDVAEGAPQRGVANYLYVNIQSEHSVDDACRAMKEAGATITHPPRDLFYGHRVGRVVDRYGVAWALSKECALQMDQMPAKWGH